MADIYACGVFEFMYDVGANNIKLGRDRKMARRGSWLAREAAVNRHPMVLELFLLRFHGLETFAHYYW